MFQDTTWNWLILLVERLLWSAIHERVVESQNKTEYKYQPYTKHLFKIGLVISKKMHQVKRKQVIQKSCRNISQKTAEIHT